MNFNFDICVGGGCSVVLFCVCAFFFASDAASVRTLCDMEVWNVPP